MRFIDERSRYTLDATAILALRAGGEESRPVENVLRRAIDGTALIFVSFATVLEVYHHLLREQGEEAARDIYLDLKVLPVEQVGSSDVLLLAAGRLRASYNITSNQAWVLATAKFTNSVLVHGDPAFEVIEEVDALSIRETAP